MASFNKIIIVGYLGRDPEMRYTPQGTAVCNFSIATTEKRRDKAGDNQDVTTWFRVNAWNKLAELANQYLSKGKQVYVEGRLRQDEYTDRDGNRRQTLEVTATEIHFLSPRDGGQSGGGFDAPMDDRSSAPPSGDDEIPF
ncbi:MAG: single-stranded DNA-binding protein [Blastocatellales bacterium]